MTAGLLSLQAQSSSDETSLYYYRIFFYDKGATVWDLTPEQLLSPAAIARREKYEITAPDINDLPVSAQYITTVTQYGLAYKCASKWMNTALFTSSIPVNEGELEQLLFISRVQLVKHPADPAKRTYNKYGTTETGADSDAFDPRAPLNGTILHQSGFTGKNVTIAVLDAGFDNADLIEALEPLRQRGGIIATHDFVTGYENVYDYNNHGTSVMSILAGSLPGIIAGTAPGADYLLLRTEDDETEFPVEMDYWAAAAEYADSAGADIITSSLGYYTFDDPAMDYSFSDMDGNTTFISRAADIAASKGILVVSSAGNERNKEWVRIIAPSDGDSVLCVGAVRQDMTISDFSSAGYSSDGQVKPDVVAPGVGIPIQLEQGLWYAGSGTSFSCPVISGLSASLMQAVPEATPAEIIKALQLGAGNEILEREIVWTCLSCATCFSRCPVQINMGAVMDALRILAVEKGLARPEGNMPLMNRVLLETIRRFGRTYDLGAMAFYKAGTATYTKDLEKFPSLLIKGKIALLPPRGADRKVVKQIFKNIAKTGER